MTEGAYVVIGAALAIGGIAVLRVAWSRQRRSFVLNAAGWTLLLAGAIAASCGAGAWGVSMAALSAMGAAFLCLAHAAISSPKARKVASNRRAGMLPISGEPLELVRRIVTFALVALFAVLPAIGAGLGCVILGRALDWSLANTYALAFFAVPLAWTMIAYALLMQRGPRGQFRVLAIATIPALPVLVGAVA